MKKQHVAILCGGESAEHEISLLSARNVYQALDPQKYTATLLGIDKQGRWHLLQSAAMLGQKDGQHLPQIAEGSAALAIAPGERHDLLFADARLKQLPPFDVVFPVLHGPRGEDGTVQGLLKLLNLPFVGCDVLGSAVGMDKEAMKRLLRDANLPICKFVVCYDHEKEALRFDEVAAKLGLPFFVKPANMGSSVGIHKVKSEADWALAIEDAFLYDEKILIEEAIIGREIECAVLGNENPVASVPGEIVPHDEFYSYEAKYIDENGASLIVPAKLPEHLVGQIQALAVKVFKTLYCAGLSRVDFFLRGEEIYVNEINTMPGFTNMSMYPKMWEASGISQPELLDKLIQLAISRFNKLSQLKKVKE